MASMGIVLRWREEPFDCEFRDASAGAALSVYSQGEMLWKEPVGSAADAHDRARELRAMLLAPRRARPA